MLCRTARQAIAASTAISKPRKHGSQAPIQRALCPGIVGGTVCQVAGTSSPTPWVVLDSHVFGGRDRYLESNAGQVLRSESRAGRLCIAVPEVLIESDANHRRAVRAARDRLVATRRELEELRDPPDAHDFNPDVDTARIWRRSYAAQVGWFCQFRNRLTTS